MKWMKGVKKKKRKENSDVENTISKKKNSLERLNCRFELEKRISDPEGRLIETMHYKEQRGKGRKTLRKLWDILCVSTCLQKE